MNDDRYIPTENEIDDFLLNLRQGITVEEKSPYHKLMHYLSQRALKITAEINGTYHSPEKVRELISRLTGKIIDESFVLFPPVYTDCGMNIFIGRNVFINSGCHFQDQGGIYIGDGSLIGSQVVIATVNHELDPEHRGDNILSSVHIGKNVWIGSHATILPGVKIGDNAVVAAGAVVTKDVEANAIVAGVPARFLKSIDQNVKKDDIS